MCTLPPSPSSFPLSLPSSPASLPLPFQSSSSSHYTKTTTWVDPRSLTPISLMEFEWNTLPPGWERFLDEQGDIYYVK